MPAGLFKHVINPLMRFLLRSPAGRGMGKVLLLLTYTGRKSRRVYTTPVSYTREGDVFTLFTDSGWALNFIEPSPVEILVERKLLRGTAQTFTDPEVVAEAILHELQTHGAAAARRLGFRPGEQPDADALRKGSAYRKLVRITVSDR